MHEMREELEDLSFRELNPDAYQVVSQRLIALAERNRGLIGEIEQQLKKKLTDRGIAVEVKSRQKRPYSMWRKMERKSVGFEQLSDIFGFRLIVQHRGGLLPGARHRPHHLADGARPVQGLPVDAQAERLPLDPHDRDRSGQPAGGAADSHRGHAPDRRIRHRRACALQGRPRLAVGNAVARIARLSHGCGTPSSFCRRASNSEEFLEHTKLELFHDQVFCFTPKGKLIALPRKATAIDFAYAVHTDVGNMAVGCKINGKISPLVSELGNGDEVEIITSKAQTAPPAAWEIDRRHRQGARRDPPRHAGGGSRPIRRPRPAHRRAPVRARQEGIFRREAAGRAAAAGARLDRGRDGRGRARRDEGLRRRPRHVSGLQGGARHARAGAEGGQRLVRAQEGAAAQVQGAGDRGCRARSRSAASTAACR